MCVHHTKNYRRGLLRLIEFEARGSISMDREERLRRRREQARLRRAAETPEQREARNLKLCIVANYCMLAYLVQARSTMLLASV